MNNSHKNPYRVSPLDDILFIVAGWLVLATMIVVGTVMIFA